MDKKDTFYFFNVEAIKTSNSCVKRGCNYSIAFVSGRTVEANLIKLFVKSDLVRFYFNSTNEGEEFILSINIFSSEKLNWKILDSN